MQFHQATLPDHALPDDPDTVFPGPAPWPGDHVDGIYLDARSGADLSRIAFFAETMGLVAKDVRLASGRDAVAFLAASEPDAAQPHWQAETWPPKWGALALEVSDEIMGYFRRYDVQDVAWRVPMAMARAAARLAAADGVPADVRSAMTASAVDCCEMRAPHEGYFLTREYALRHPGFGGGTSPLLKREVFVATDAAIVLPYDPVRDRVLLVEQFRMGPYGRGDPRPWSLEPVAGRVDAGETPEEAARRECVEEARIALGSLELISRHYCSPGCSTEYFHLYLGLCTLPEDGHGQGGLATENEDIRTHILPFDRAVRLLETGEADNGPLVLSLTWLSRERERLRASA